jgi:hypothetical protein
MNDTNVSSAPVDEECDPLNDCHAGTSNEADSEERQFPYEDDQALGAVVRCGVLALRWALDRINKDAERLAEELEANGGSDD